MMNSIWISELRGQCVNFAAWVGCEFEAMTSKELALSLMSFSFIGLEAIAHRLGPERGWMHHPRMGKPGKGNTFDGNGWQGVWNFSYCFIGIAAAPIQFRFVMIWLWEIGHGYIIALPLGFAAIIEPIRVDPWENEAVPRGLGLAMGKSALSTLIKHT